MNEQLTLKVRKLSDHATLPTYAHEGDSGADLYAAEDAVIQPKQTALIPTDLAVDIPEGFEIQVRPRSGLTLKSPLRVAFGTVDQNYFGNIGIIADNVGYDDYIVRKGDRIAQMVVAPVFRADFVEIAEFDETSERGNNGFGSSGMTGGIE